MQPVLILVLPVTGATWVAWAVLLVPSAAVAGVSGYLLVLALAAFSHQDEPTAQMTDGTAPQLAVVVPAHDEHDLIGRCVATLRTQDYPAGAYRIVVVADNCGDDTAAQARAAGAEVIERCDSAAPGKGRALRWAMDRLLLEDARIDAIVVVDADSVASPGLLRALAGKMLAGAEAVQADYRVLEDSESPGVLLRGVAFLLFHRVRFAGRDALGLGCSLVGNGMLFSRGLLERLPWSAFTAAEDLEYTLELRLAGVKPQFAGLGVVEAPVPAGGRAAQVQRERWEGGRLAVARRGLPRLAGQIARGRFSLVDAAVDLLVPPLGLLAVAATGLSAMVAAAAGWGAVPFWMIAVPGFAAVATAGYVLLGLRAIGVPAGMYGRLLAAPAFVVRKILGTRAVLQCSGGNQWIRTERPSDVAH